MEFTTVRDFRTQSAKVWQKLEKEKELIVTSNGKPFAVMMPVTGTQLEESLKIIRKTRAELALKRMQSQAIETGLNKMTNREIEAEIKATRKK